MAYGRLIEKRGLLFSLLALACTSEQVVMVEPSFVEVTPAEASAIEGETIQLVGAIHDDEDNSVTSNSLVWTSADTTIATVSRSGLVFARSAGEVTIRARFETVMGQASVEVLRGPFVVLVPAAVTFYTSPGAAPAPQVVAVSNGGAGKLEQLTTAVSYETEPRNWLRPSLAAAAAPTSLTLQVEPAGIGAGTHRSTVSVGALAGDGARVDVVLNVAGFAVRPTGPGTSVVESGTTDQIGVVLSSQPSAPVVLQVTTTDPGETSVSPASLRFLRTNWDREQMITVRGVDDIEDDGDQVSIVSIAVDGAQSPDTYEALAARTVSVTTQDNDEPPGIVIVETLGSTVVSENNTTDAFTVALAAPIATNVVLEVVTTNPFEVGVISAANLTFTPANWNVPQTVTVIGIDDFFFDGDRQVSVTVRVLDIYSDPRYAGLARSVLVTNLDNELIG